MGDEEHVALPQGSEHVVGDGLRVLVRPLVAADRAELAAGYRKLSSRSRHTRFFVPRTSWTKTTSTTSPCSTTTTTMRSPHLPSTHRDGRASAWLATCVSVTARRMPRSRSRCSTGISAGVSGRCSCVCSRSIAVTHGVSTFVYYVEWENEEMIEELRVEGARVSPDEAGVARIELDLPGEGDELGERTVHQITRTLAQRLRDVFERVQSTAGPPTNSAWPPATRPTFGIRRSDRTVLDQPAPTAAPTAAITGPTCPNRVSCRTTMASAPRSTARA